MGTDSRSFGCKIRQKVVDFLDLRDTWFSDCALRKLCHPIHINASASGYLPITQAAFFEQIVCHRKKRLRTLHRRSVLHYTLSVQPITLQCVQNQDAWENHYTRWCLRRKLRSGMAFWQSLLSAA